jgi:lipopolysaccharide/colanic/teichoic acid biosynthesis glycosyltransferase
LLVVACNGLCSPVIAKRIADFVLTALGLLFLSPFLVGMALMVWVRNGRPVLFVATRVGQHGRAFRLYKFRTMLPSDGSSVTVRDDPRVTPLGRVLRRSKLDELPQLFNVLKGDMSLVGPRPQATWRFTLPSNAGFWN